MNGTDGGKPAGAESVITGTHAILDARKTEATRKSLREVLELPSVDAGGGEMGFYQPKHPSPPSRGNSAR